MKLSEIHHCDNCDKPLMQGGIFYVVRFSMVFISPEAYRQTMGINMILGGGSLAISEALSPDPEVIKIAGDENRKLMTELLICLDCYVDSLNLAVMAEKKAMQETPK